MMTISPSYFSQRTLSTGMDSLQGPHQVAMKSKRTTFTLKSLRLNLFPSISVKVNSEASSVDWRRFHTPIKMRAATKRTASESRSEGRLLTSILQVKFPPFQFVISPEF